MAGCRDKWIVWLEISPTILTSVWPLPPHTTTCRKPEKIMREWHYKMIWLTMKLSAWGCRMLKWTYASSYSAGRKVCIITGLFWKSYPNLYMHQSFKAIHWTHYVHYSHLVSANGCHTSGALQLSLTKTSPPSLLIPSFRALLSAGKLGC